MPMLRLSEIELFGGCGSSFFVSDNLHYLNSLRCMRIIPHVSFVCTLAPWNL